MTDDAAFSFAVAQRSIALLVAISLAVFAVLALFAKGNRIGNVLPRALVATLMFAVPAGFAMLVGLVATSVLNAVSAPPPTYIFTGFAAVATFRPAIKYRGEMAGCMQFLGVGLASYALSWSLVSFWMTGGCDAASRGQLPAYGVLPPLAALPFVAFILKLSGDKRTLWLFIGSLAFFCLLLALMFLPVENGFAAALLPGSDWLRFPLVGAAWAAGFVAIRLAAFSRLKPNIRRSRRRDLRFGLMFVGGMLIAGGFSWALARTVLRAIVGPV